MTDAPGTPPPGWTGSPAPRNGMGTAALVLGIVGLVLALPIIGLLPGIVAIVLGIIGVRRANRGEATNREDEFCQRLLAAGFPLDEAYPLPAALRGDLERFTQDGYVPSLEDVRRRAR